MSLVSGRLGRAVLRGAGGFGSGGVIGALAGVASALHGGSTPTSVPGFGGTSPGGYNMPFPVNGPGGRPLPGFNPPASGPAPRGFHLNKHALAPTKKHGAVAARTIWVRNRHVNPLNARALKRALGREKRAAKLIRRLHVFRPAHPVQRKIGGGHK